MSLDGKQFGRYHLQQRLGSGGMGEVYLANDTLINRQVAIKIIRSEINTHLNPDEATKSARLFQREMRAISQLDHPNILPLFDYGEEVVNNVTTAFLVMPYRPEGSLAQWITQRGGTGTLSTQDIVHVIGQAANALQHAHEHQIIHQDVKPANFLLRIDPQKPNRPDVFLADFGVAKLSSATSNTSQAIRGTPTYMSPEQWEGNPVPATDQYALAVMAYELLTGQPLFQGNPSQMMFKHLTTEPQRPSAINAQLPKELDTVLLRALAKKPEQRFPNVMSFGQSLQAALQGIDLPTVIMSPQKTSSSPTNVPRPSQTRIETPFPSGSAPGVVPPSAPPPYHTASRPIAPTPPVARSGTEPTVIKSNLYGDKAATTHRASGTPGFYAAPTYRGSTVQVPPPLVKPVQSGGGSSAGRVALLVVLSLFVVAASIGPLCGVSRTRIIPGVLC